jgi:hypothetical protein
MEAISIWTLRFIAVGGASPGLPGLLGTLAAIAYIHMAALSVIRG